MNNASQNAMRYRLIRALHGEYCFCGAAHMGEHALFVPLAAPLRRLHTMYNMVNSRCSLLWYTYYPIIYR